MNKLFQTALMAALLITPGLAGENQPITGKITCKDPMQVGSGTTLNLLDGAELTLDKGIPIEVLGTLEGPANGKAMIKCTNGKATVDLNTFAIEEIDSSEETHPTKKGYSSGNTYYCINHESGPGEIVNKDNITFDNVAVTEYNLLRSIKASEINDSSKTLILGADSGEPKNTSLVNPDEESSYGVELNLANEGYSAADSLTLTGLFTVQGDNTHFTEGTVTFDNSEATFSGNNSAFQSKMQVTNQSVVTFNKSVTLSKDIAVTGGSEIVFKELVKLTNGAKVVIGGTLAPATPTVMYGWNYPWVTKWIHNSYTDTDADGKALGYLLFHNPIMANIEKYSDTNELTHQETSGYSQNLVYSDGVFTYTADYNENSLNSLKRTHTSLGFSGPSMIKQDLVLTNYEYSGGMDMINYKNINGTIGWDEEKREYIVKNGPFTYEQAYAYMNPAEATYEQKSVPEGTKVFTKAEGNYEVGFYWITAPEMIEELAGRITANYLNCVINSTGQIINVINVPKPNDYTNEKICAYIYGPINSKYYEWYVTLDQYDSVDSFRISRSDSLEGIPPHQTLSDNLVFNDIPWNETSSIGFTCSNSNSSNFTIYYSSLARYADNETIMSRKIKTEASYDNDNEFTYKELYDLFSAIDKNPSSYISVRQF